MFDFSSKICYTIGKDQEEEIHMCSRAFRYRAYLTDDQFVLAMKTVGSCRFVYNDALNYKTT